MQPAQQQTAVSDSSTHSVADKEVVQVVNTWSDVKTLFERSKESITIDFKAFLASSDLISKTLVDLRASCDLKIQNSSLTHLANKINNSKPLQLCLAALMQDSLFSPEHTRDLVEFVESKGCQSGLAEILAKKMTPLVAITFLANSVKTTEEQLLQICPSEISEIFK